MQQGTAEWHVWRRQGIGASESAALLGVCPYKTARQLYGEKLGMAMEDTESSPGLFRAGHETEAMVRAEYEFETGMEYAPAVFEHPVYPFIRASLDGWNAEGNPPGIEVKLVGKEKFAAPIPEHHFIQVQHQMLVTSVTEWMYIRHNAGQTKKEIIRADHPTQARILAACLEFWDRVQRQDPPPYADRDWVPVDDAQLLGDLMAVASLTGKSKDALREQIFGRLQYNRVICGGIKVARDSRRITMPKETR